MGCRGNDLGIYAGSFAVLQTPQFLVSGSARSAAFFGLLFSLIYFALLGLVLTNFPGQLNFSATRTSSLDVLKKCSAARLFVRNFDFSNFIRSLIRQQKNYT